MQLIAHILHLDTMIIFMIIVIFYNSLFSMTMKIRYC